MRHRPFLIGMCVALGLTALLTSPTALADGADDPSGTWESTFGRVAIEFGPDDTERTPALEAAKAKKARVKSKGRGAGSTHAVHGRWFQAPNRVGVIREGTYDETKRLLTFTYYQSWNNLTGTAKFTLSADGLTFDGDYKQPGESGAWVLTRAVRLTHARRAAKIDELVARAGCSENTPGVGILITHRGRTVVEKCYGLADLKTRRPLRPRTPVELASISKSLTAVALMRLVDRGLLSTDDNARKYVPELPVADRRYPIRVDDLLHQTSGLPLYTRFEYPKGRHADYVTNDDYAREFVRQRAKFPSRFAPGQKYEYSNTNYMLLALIIERVAKKPFHIFMREEIFAPLGMKNAWVYQSPKAPLLDASGRSRSAMGYSRTAEGVFEPNRTLPPDGNEFLLTGGDGYTFASLEDMKRWDAAIRSETLVKSATWRRALAPSQTRDGERNMYGFGLMLTNDSAGRLEWIGHTGGNNGVSTAWWRNLLHDRCVIVLCCCPSFDGQALWAAVDRLCGDLD